ncbi:MAG: ABC transporter substrate-binding protein [Proteobacteria bacterium]|nr:ABC transporter substrate-binding protein [Pseudomonadota bacterium]
MKHILLAAMIAHSALSITPAMASGADNNLTVAFPRELESLDAYQNSSRGGVILARHIWDGLMYRDPASGKYVGNLATEWRWVDDKTLEFNLREGVKFHNGEAFNADDVVFTMNYIADPANAVKPQRNASWIAGAEKVDDFTVRILLKEPFPAAFEYLAGPVVIYPNEYFSEVGTEGMGTAPIGTGPYKVTGQKQGERIDLKRYADYHSDSPKGKASIEEITWRFIPETNTQFAELISGGVDWIWQVPADQAERFKTLGDFVVSNESTMRIGYIGFDASDRYGDTPFDDVRVRRAVAHAIDRQGIVDSLLKGASIVVNSACFPSQFGCEQDIPTYDFNPEKARELLTEAGYADGFETPFAAYRNRDYAEVMMANLSNVGITTSLNYLKYAALRDKVQNGEIPFQFMTWGSFSINDVSAITSNFFKGGKDDYARDPQIIEWLTEADSITDAARREELYSMALKRIAEQVYWLPLFSYNTNYIYGAGLEFTPTSDEIPRFFNASWK